MPAFLAPIAVFFSLFQELWSLFKKPKYRTVLIWMLVILLTGTIFYHREEGWSWLDALYFSVITLATVGYGDLSPTTPLSKIFTMAYILVGFSVFVSFASMLTKERTELRRRRANLDDAGQ
jgi:voltage-gated potassium channel Kch